MKRALPCFQSALRSSTAFLMIALISNIAWAQSCPVGTAPKITSAKAVTFTVGVQGSFSITTSGTPSPTITETGNLPAGVTFRRGRFSGTPQTGTAAKYAVTLTASNGILPAASMPFVLTVVGAPVSTPPTPPPPPTNPPPPPISTGGSGDGAKWIPPQITSWQWQLSGPPSASSLLSVNMYDVDGFDSSASLVSAMHAQGTQAVCYLSLGTWENWRSDAGSFPASVLGSGNGWPGEKWLDIRQISTLAPIMTARFQMCLSKGFDAVEPDNIDGYSNSTGFPLTAADQIAYNQWIAQTVHSLGMSVALKNDVDQVSQLQPSFDFVIDEQCFQYNECNSLLPFVNAGKAVFEVEYQGSASTICPKANALNFNTLIKDLNLTATRTACR
jgi:hypothetical protein